jgi:hypothetical protein
MIVLRQSQMTVVNMRRMFRVFGIVMLLVGAMLILISLGVFLTQGSQIEVTATVLSEHCHSQYDLALSTSQIRCDASVRFATRSGQIIRTTVTDAFPYEFGHRPGLPTTIQLRYDSTDPADPFKQSNYMPVGEFLPLLGAGAVATTFGVLWAARAERYAEHAVRRRTGSPG